MCVWYVHEAPVLQRHRSFCARVSGRPRGQAAQERGQATTPLSPHPSASGCKQAAANSKRGQAAGTKQRQLTFWPSIPRRLPSHTPRSPNASRYRSGGGDRSLGLDPRGPVHLRRGPPSQVGHALPLAPSEEATQRRHPQPATSPGTCRQCTIPSTDHGAEAWILHQVDNDRIAMLKIKVGARLLPPQPTVLLLLEPLLLHGC